jgi:ABC-type polysaccharide/polyol phosphate export permease
MKTKKYKRWFELLMAMTLKELRARYKMAIFGFLWMFLNPVLQMLVMGFIFQFFVPIEMDNYFEFIFPGLLAWNFFAYTVSKNTPMYVNERALIQKAKFPREVVVLAVVLSNLFHFFVALVLFVVWLALIRGEIYWQLWWVMIMAVIWLTMLTSGLSLLLSSLNVRWRDINFGVQALLPLWFYATPIVYSLEWLPMWLTDWLKINPMTGVVELLRLSVGLESGGFYWQGLLVTIFILTLGIVVFKRESLFFDDWI